MTSCPVMDIAVVPDLFGTPSDVPVPIDWTVMES